MWSLAHFDDILDKMKGLQEPTVWYHDLQTSTGGSCACNQAQQEKGTFQPPEIHSSRRILIRLRAVSLLSWSVEQSARDTQMTTRVTEGARRERHSNFFLLGLPPSFLTSRGFAVRRALPSLNLKKKRDCSQSTFWSLLKTFEQSKCKIYFLSFLRMHLLPDGIGKTLNNERWTICPLNPYWRQS